MFKPARIVIATCMTAVLAACGGGSPETAEVKNTIVVAQGSDAKSLDPHYTNDQPSFRVAVQVYSQLVEVDENMQIIPGLAKSWDYLDDRTTQFHIRQGVKFHNGEELKASDVKFSIDRMLGSPTVAHIINAVESVEVVDDYTVNVITHEPFGPLLYHLTHTAASILNEKAVTEAGQDYGQHPIGTGPYEFVDWTVGDRVTMKAFDDYYGGTQAVDNLVFRSVVEGTNRAIALETGETDLAYDIEPIDKQTVLDKKELVLVEEESLATAYFGFNTRKTPFDKKEVRQAIAYAINSQDMIDAVEMGAGRPANSPIGPKVFGYNPDAKLYEQDYAKARELMAKAGLSEGFRTTIWTNDNPIRVQLAQVIQAQLRQINIDVAIEVVEWGAFLDGTSRGDHEMFILGWVTVTGDADYGLYALFNSATHGSAGNRSFIEDPKVDELLNNARRSTDPEERQALYHEIQEIVQEEVPHVSLYNQSQNVGMQSNVKGFSMSPGGHHRIRGVSFEG